MAIIIASILALPIAFAQTSSDTSKTTHTYQTFEGNLGYIDLMRTTERHSYPVAFNPPDGISKIESVEVTFIGDFPTETNLNVLLNGQSCNPDSWRTPKYEVSNYKMSFQCTGLIKEIVDIANFNIDVSSDKEARNVIGWYKINYQNDWKLPSVLADNILKPTMQMHGTEYTIGEKAKLWLQAIDTAGKYVNTAACYVDIYYPYGTIFVERASMNLLEDGVYYYDVMVPDLVGVYPVIGLCYYSTTTQEETADAGYILNGSQGSGSYLSTATKNNAYWNVDEALTNGIQRIAVGLNYTSITQPSGLTEVDFNFQGRWDGGTDTITMYFYNWSSSTWQALPNTIPDTGSTDLDVANTIATSNATTSGILKNGTSYIQFRDTTNADASSSRLRIDYMAINLLNLSGDKSTEIKGSSEMHVKSISTISDYVILSDECGNDITSDEASTCGRVVNYSDGNSNYPEMEVEINFTATSLASDDNTDTEWIYYSPISFDCTSLLWIAFWNGTRYIDVTGNATIESKLTDENCKITMPITVNISGIYYYSIVMDNYIRWEINWIEQQRKIIHDFIYPRCAIYAAQYNYTFTVPIKEGTFVSPDSYISGCHNLLNDDYYMSRDYNLSLNMTTIKELIVPFVELLWYEDAMLHHMDLDSMESGFINYDMLSSMNVSVLGNTPANMWSYPNRTLTDYNQTMMWNYLSEINATEHSAISLINSVNNSIYIRINQISVQIDGMNSSINNHVSNILNQLYLVNQSIHDSIYNMNQSVTNAIYQINGSIMTELYSMNKEISGISSNMTNITNTLLGLNSSLSSQLDIIQTKVDNLGIQINAVNNSVMSKLYAMQGEISSVNDTIKESNISIMNKLYTIQGDLDNLLQKLTLQLANISNLTINLTGDLSSVANDVWEIFFYRGTPPLAPSTNYYCKPSDTNILIKNITYDYKGHPPLSGYFSKEEEELCSYGCVNQSILSGHATCDIDPSSKYLIAIAIVVILIVIFSIIYRHYGSEEGG